MQSREAVPLDSRCVLPSFVLVDVSIEFRLIQGRVNSHKIELKIGLEIELKFKLKIEIKIGLNLRAYKIPRSVSKTVNNFFHYGVTPYKNSEAVHPKIRVAV